MPPMPPRLEIVNEPPCICATLSVPVRAFSLRLRRLGITARGVKDKRMMGVVQIRVARGGKFTLSG